MSLVRKVSFPNKKSKHHVISLFLTVLVISFLFFGLYKCLGKKVVSPQENSGVFSLCPLAPTSEVDEDLIKRCGDIPNDIPDSAMVTKSDHWTVITGLKWSPDCRYIAWGIWESGVGFVGEGDVTISPRKVDPREGIYLYNDSTKKSVRVYKPKNIGESPRFIGWKDRWTILFETGKSTFFYDLTSKTIQPVESN